MSESTQMPEPTRDNWPARMINRSLKQAQHIKELEEGIVYLQKQLEEVYIDRNQAALLAAVLAGPSVTVGFRADPDEPDWPVLYIELPGGQQVSWHIYKGDLAGMELGDMPEFPSVWDGHTTEEKRERIAAFIRGAFSDRS